MGYTAMQVLAFHATLTRKIEAELVEIFCSETRSLIRANEHIFGFRRALWEYTSHANGTATRGLMVLSIDCLELFVVLVCDF
jgi:hypothetical protein